MLKQIDPVIYGLPKRTVLQSDGQDIIIVKQRKSRIIMKDSRQIMEIADKIKKHDNKVHIKLLISGPICSKSIKYLSEKDVEILY